MRYVLDIKPNPHPYLSKFGAGLLVVIAATVQLGCATSGSAPPKAEHRALLDELAVVAGPRYPDLSLEGFARSKGEGALAGAGTTLFACVEPLGSSGCTGSVCGAAVILWLGVCGVATAVGGVVGAATAPSGAQVSESETRLTDTLSAQDISQVLRDQVASAARADGTELKTVAREIAWRAAQLEDYRPLARSGVQVVLETTITHVGTRGSGINAPLQLYMKARARLVKTRDNAEVFSEDYEYAGEKLTLSAWSSNQGKRMQHALVKGYEALGVHVYESVFLLYPFPNREAQSIGILSAGFGLAPIDPVTRGQLTGDPIFGDRFEWTTIDQLRPTLRWQAFPRPSDIVAAPEEMNKVRNVRYDLAIAREQNLAPVEIVYRRRGLIGTEHSLEQPLTRATRYFWTVRARFELNGEERLTEWGSVHFQARENLTAPSQYSYRFKTPK
jgi:hypothetical protein